MHLRNLLNLRDRGAISNMRTGRTALAMGLVLGAFASHPSCYAQSSLTAASSAHVSGKDIRRSEAPVTLTQNDGLSVIAAALDSRAHLNRQSDCSHLVHAIYDRAGFSYPYSSSSDLFDGTDEFRRVKHPQPGDLVVWSGHVGIVVNPAQHAFFSTLSHGPGIDSYDAEYWKGRGPVRFYRYIKRRPRLEAPKPE
jgi:cell wall-associated NlpC family hydrolase